MFILNRAYLLWSEFLHYLDDLTFVFTSKQRRLLIGLSLRLVNTLINDTATNKWTSGATK